MIALFIVSHLYRALTQPKINNSLADEIFLVGCFVGLILLSGLTCFLILHAKDCYRARCRTKAEAQAGLHITKLLILVSFLFVSHSHAQTVQTSPTSLFVTPPSGPALLDTNASPPVYLTRTRAIKMLLADDPNLNAFTELTVYAKHYPTIVRRGDVWIMTFPKE